jgi:hypothetical protein
MSAVLRNNMTALGRKIHQALMGELKATDQLGTNRELAEGVGLAMVRRGYTLAALPDEELAADKWNGLPREYCEYRAAGHDAGQALLDAVRDCDDEGSYDAMAAMVMIMLSNYGYQFTKGKGAPKRCWKEWNE